MVFGVPRNQTAGRGVLKGHDIQERQVAAAGAMAVSSSSGPAGPAPEQGEKPIGRRAVLGILGLGGLGIAFGEHVQNGISDLLAPLRGTGLAGLVTVILARRYGPHLLRAIRNPEPTRALDSTGLDRELQPQAA